MKIQYKLYDTNLISGSSDILRNSLGGYYVLLQDPEDIDNLYFDFVDASTPDDDVFGEAVIDVHRNRMIEKITIGRWNATVTSSNSIFPYYVLPVSIKGKVVDEDVETSQLSVTSEKWKNYILGGNYNDVEYPGIFSYTIHDVNNFSFELPYTKLYAKSIDNHNYGSYITIDSKSVYNSYIPAYQGEPEVTPNFINLNAYEFIYCTLVDQEKSDVEVREAFTMGGFYDHTDKDLFSTNMLDYPALVKTKYQSLVTVGTADKVIYADELNNSRNYFYDLGISTSGSSANTYYLNKESINNLFGLVNENKNHFPFYNKISLPSFNGSTLNESIVRSKFSNLLLKSLKDAFVDNLIPTSTNNFAAEISSKVLNDDGNVVERTTVQNTSYKYVDLLSVLAQISNNPIPNVFNIERFIGESHHENKAPTTTSGVYRHINKINAYNMLDYIYKGALSTFPTADFSTAIETDGSSTVYMPWADTSTITINSFLSLANNTLNNKSECVALRIEKTDSVTNELVSNVIIQNQPLNSTNVGTHNANDVQNDLWCYYDTEVKYGNPYTYTTYAYFMVVGYKYEYADLALSRPISDYGQYEASELATIRAGGFTEAEATAAEALGFNFTCIEFYDPSTEQAVPSPMKTSIDNQLSPERVSLLLTTQAEGYATAAQELAATNSFNWADFNLKIEPTIKIFEIPIETKTLTVLDNPPPKPEVQPYQVKDQSQGIGFFIRLENPPVKEGFIRTNTYPTPLDSDERLMYARYLNSQNMLDTDKLIFGTVSRPSRVQIYRLSHRPKSMSEFAGNLVATKSLVIRDENDKLNRTYISPVCFYNERIATSHKFYYAFRFVNENNTPGPWSNVIQAELVDDGGYKYSVFDSIMESELDSTTKYEYPHYQFKKLLMLRPTIPQIDLDASNVDYTLNAEDAFDDVLIGKSVSSKLWDKTYKIRLTSKKTGKKIDLNVTYNLSQNKNTPE